jgi:hypothetical protein
VTFTVLLWLAGCRSWSSWRGSMRCCARIWMRSSAGCCWGSRLRSWGGWDHDGGRGYRGAPRVTRGNVSRVEKTADAPAAPRGVHLLLQVRIQVLNDDLVNDFHRVVSRLHSPGGVVFPTLSSSRVQLTFCSLGLRKVGQRLLSHIDHAWLDDGLCGVVFVLLREFFGEFLPRLGALHGEVCDGALAVSRYVVGKLPPFFAADSVHVQ